MVKMEIVRAKNFIARIVGSFQVLQWSVALPPPMHRAVASISCCCITS